MLPSIFLTEEEVKDDADNRQEEKNDYPCNTFYRITIFRYNNQDRTYNSNQIYYVQAVIYPLVDVLNYIQIKHGIGYLGYFWKAKLRIKNEFINIYADKNLPKFCMDRF